MRGALVRGTMRVGVLSGLAVLVVFACSNDDDEFREDVLACEEAVAHLQSCCPGITFNASTCQFFYDDESSCSPRFSYPAFSTYESACIRERSCAELVSGDICRRANNAQPRRNDAGERLAVCP